MNKIILFLLIFFGIQGSFVYNAQDRNIKSDLIPFPQNLQAASGSFNLNGQELLYYMDNNIGSGALEQWLSKSFFGQIHKRQAQQNKANLQLLKETNIPKEGYKLVINQNGIKISASTSQGLWYGLQTVQQLYVLSGSALPYLTINDYPVFQWRGVELDVARHFFSKEYLYKLIDLLSFYKFNKLHLHLTDDQGWRIEIKKYPKLTTQGAWRTFNNHDSTCIAKAKDNTDFNLPSEFIRNTNGKIEYGGFYTQDDIKDIISYATNRHIEIIPEIDMPGHMKIATQLYPELLLDSSSAGWGKKFSIPISPWKESSYTFVEDVLSELMELFPSRYIHIGADEVDQDSWAESPQAKDFMKKQGINSLHDLQSYFVNRVNKFIRSRNKVSIGWDEIVEGNSDKNMTVMYWRTWMKNAYLEAINRGHNVIMTPVNPLYFDYLPNSSSLSAVYHMNVVPTDVPKEKSGLILGAQANIWTEIIPSTARLEFMILPRLSALAERLWTHKSLYDTYKSRLVSHYKVWDEMGLRYRMPDLSGFADHQVIIDGQSVLKVVNPLTTTSVHYTDDGSVPEQKSPVLSDSLIIKKEGTVRFSTISSSGAKSEIYRVDFKKGNWKKAPIDNNTTLKPGLYATFFNGAFDDTKAISGPELKTEVIKNVSLDGVIKLPSFGTKITGYLHIRKKGIYNFYLTCDDGGVLKIGGEEIVNNDGKHPSQTKSGQIALEEGYHPIAIDFIEAGGGFTLKLQYSLNGSETVDIPDECFFYKN